MSNCGPADAFGTDGEPPEDALPEAKVPPRPWKVGYPAEKFVVKPGRLVMVVKGYCRYRRQEKLVGWLARGRVQVLATYRNQQCSGVVN